jgi:hypothetical protein
MCLAASSFRHHIFQWYKTNLFLELIHLHVVIRRTTINEVVHALELWIVQREITAAKLHVIFELLLHLLKINKLLLHVLLVHSMLLHFNLMVLN